MNQRSKYFWWLTAGMGIGYSGYYKVKFILTGQLKVSDLFRWNVLLDLGYAMSLAAVIMSLHQLTSGYLRKKFPKNSQPVKRFAIQFLASGVASILGSLFFLYSFWGVLTGYQPPVSFVFDTIVFAILLPFIINGIVETTYYYDEWHNESLRTSELEKENLRARYEILKNQINPHFLFNSFNTLSELIAESKKVAARFLSQLSNVYRFVLENKNNELVDLKSELQVLESYIYLQKIRFGENLHIELDIDEEHMYNFIPPLTLQMLLENALKHNITSQEQPLTIQVKSNKDNQLIFTNNLQKKASATSTKTGLQNIINRYKLLTSEKVEVKENLTSFVVSVPLIHVSYG